jgi:hypothetical protein
VPACSGEGLDILDRALGREISALERANPEPSAKQS